MKKQLFILFFLVTTILSAQTDGLSYQAVIINQTAQELPGVDATGNIYPNKSLSVRFTISNSTGVEYQEVQSTSTDAYGMINLTIGHGSALSGAFTEINWDGQQKDLKVEINIDGGYTVLSTQPLLYIPYTLHRDITATGNLLVDGGVGFLSDLEVDGETNLNSSLTVNNLSPTVLSGTIDVDGASKLNSTLEVDGATTLNNSLTVTEQNPTSLTGTLVVDGVADFNNAINVNNQSPVYFSGNLEVDGTQLLNNNLTVNGTTNLNSSLKVNNESSTLLTGSLITDGATVLNNTLEVRNGSATNLTGTLVVDGVADFNNAINVNNQSHVYLSGDLEIDGAQLLNNNLTVNGTTNLNSSLSINNQSSTLLTGTLTTDGVTVLNNTLEVRNESNTNLTGRLVVDGVAYFNNAINVNNQSPVYLSGDLEIDGAQLLNNNLTVNGTTNLNSSLNVNNQNSTLLTGALTTDGVTVLNNTLEVRNGSATNLTGTLDVIGSTVIKNELEVDGTTHLNNRLEVKNKATTDLSGKLIVAGLADVGGAFTVKNSSPTILTGSLNVGGATGFGGDLIIDGKAILNNSLTVQNGSSTLLSGTLETDGATNLNSTLTVDGATDLNTTLNVDGIATLKNKLNVDGTTDLNSTLTVDGATDFNTTLNVDGIATLKNKLSVDGTTDLNSTLTVDGATDLNTTLNVDGIATLKNKLNVDGATTINNISNLNGQVTVSTNIGGGDTSYNAYPLRVQGSGQGIAIKLSAGTPDNTNNFITFFNSGGAAVGRIEGETILEAVTTPEFIFDNAVLVAEEIKAGVNVGTSFIPVAVAGVVVSAGPCGACIAAAAADLILATANLVGYNIFALENLGVTYQSGSADYAEWLERADPNEKINAGDIVGVTGGKISKYTSNAQHYMVISTKPAILGNMPMNGNEELYEKVAFMGQIPVKVSGTVLSGDYILPSGLNNGIGIAVAPDDITAEQYSKIVGVAWSSSILNNGVSIINMAIGLNTNDVARLAVQLENKIEALENKFNLFEERLLALEKGTGNSPKKAVVEVLAPTKKVSRAELLTSNMPAELSDEVMEEAMFYLENAYKDRGLNIEDHPGLKKLFTDATYRAEILNKTKENYRKSYQSLLRTIKNNN